MFLPSCLITLRENLSEQKNLEASIRIIEQYFAFFGLDDAKDELWLLLAGTLTSEEANMQTVIQRSNSIFYCGYTKMLLEAAHTLLNLLPKHLSYS